MARNRSHGLNVAANPLISGITAATTPPNTWNTLGEPSATKRKRASDDTDSSGATLIKIARTTQASAPPEDQTHIEKPTSKADSVSFSSMSNLKNDSELFPGLKYPLTGTYISSSLAHDKVGDLFGSYKFDLTVTNNPTRGAWWATFRQCKLPKPGRRVYADFPSPVSDGIIHVERGPRLAVDLDSPFSLSWKLRDLRDGTFHSGVGMIVFRKRGDVFVRLFEVPTAKGPVELTGIRKGGPGIQVDLQHMWDGFAEKGPQY
ncbi:hypothetical protein BU25DRAFT_456131 [Macroventuria anomochaeta]|uniref:Uncharacterized protein n=1 Tax=Macroventuria anomochaeta TaxID=301207 RepID=A0ACB6S8Q7_9PLEO|nr:uncharacterized protein BU25DRAFT_456131 [Macroventuria anomochaeta]KAF2630392.1 hypothetical protein BU25DRAFT_456131 [Macroventuria anomochaeta]